jgi:uncharacterized protein (DUF362 family)
MPKVAITQNENISQGISEALAMLPIADLITGKVVAIKPNDTWASVEDKTAVTQPDSLRGTIRYLKAFKPKKLIVTGGSGAGVTETIFEIAGLSEVSKEERVEFFDHNQGPFVEVAIGGRQMKVMVNPRVLEYETLVALNQLKVHETATATLAMKNIAMSYPAADYYGHPRSTQKHFHEFFNDIHNFIAVMAKRFPISLAITVGHPAMIGQGPIGGKTVETGLTVASTDPLAADVVGARLLGFDPQAVGQIKEAYELGVGEIDIDKFEYPGLKLEEAVRIFAQKAYGKDINLKHA